MRIAPNVTQALLARMVFGLSPQRVVERQRFALSLAGPSLLVDGASEALRTDLRARGETLGPLGYDFSAVQLVALEQGRYLAAADARKSGLALAE
jgi:gamma-glutamyltranspeptidase